MCTVVWSNPVNDTHQFGASPLNVTTVEECKTACEKIVSCCAIDWNPNSVGDYCWLGLSCNLSIGIQVGITHYSIVTRPTECASKQTKEIECRFLYVNCRTWNRRVVALQVYPENGNNEVDDIHIEGLR